MKSTTLPLLLLTALLLAGCNLPSAAPESVAATNVPTSAAPTEPPASPEPPPTAESAAENAPGVDSCLVGVWKMDVVALNNKFLDAVPTGNMTVMAPSEAAMEFRADNSFAFGGQVTLRFEIPNSSDYLEVDGTYQGVGAYVATSGQITFVANEYVMDYGEMRAFINGQAASGAFGIVPPTPVMSPPKDALYTCAGNSLQVSYDGPNGPIVEEWSK